MRAKALDHIPGGLWFPDAYDRILNYFTTLGRRAVMAEVGTCHGKSAIYLLSQARERGIDVELHCVDNFSWSPVGLVGEALRLDWERNLNNAGVSALCHVAPSPDAARLFLDDSLDAIWIDADHSYPAVAKDIAAWTPKLRVGGIIGGDDFEMDGVKKAVQESGAYSLGPGWRKDKVYSGAWPYWIRTKE